MADFVRTHASQRDDDGLRRRIEFDPRVLDEFDVKIAPSTCSEHIGRVRAAARQSRNETLSAQIARVHARLRADRARKVWPQLN